MRGSTDSMNVLKSRKYCIVSDLASWDKNLIRNKGKYFQKIGEEGEAFLMGVPGEENPALQKM